MIDIQAAAAGLVAGSEAHAQFALPWPEDAPPTLDEAYQIQDAVYERLVPTRGPLGGFKVALSSASLQELLGIGESVGGLVHAGDITASPHRLSMADFHSPAIEFEIIARFGTSVDPSNAPYTAATIAPYVDHLAAGFEIIDTRAANLLTIGAAGIAADRCLCYGAVVGTGVDNWAGLDFATVAVELEWNGEIVETGVTGAAMGGPLNGVAWAASHVTGRGRTIEPGHIVLTGSALNPRPVEVGDTITYRVEGVGEATINVVP